jgi:VanZ family protein
VVLGWLPVLAWMALIFVLSSQPTPPRAPDELLDVLLKKAAHFVEYVVLALLLVRALVGTHEPIGWRTKTLALVVAVAYAVSDEVHQRFVPGRGPSAWDVGIDSLGAMSGVALFARWRDARR